MPSNLDDRPRTARMFSKAPRFVPEKPSEVPGPNAYIIPEQEGWDSYKRGAFLEKAERFPKEKPYEGPDSLPSTSDSTKTTKDASRASKRPEAAPNVAMLRQQIEALQTQNSKLERLYETDSKRHQEQAASDKQKIDALIKQTSQLETQLSVSQISHADNKRELERVVDRERTVKLKLERLENGSRDSGERSAKSIAMRKELDELQKLHEDGKKAHRMEVHQLKSEHERHQRVSTDQIAALKKQTDAAHVKTQECRKSLLAAQSEINDLRSKLRSQDKQKVSPLELENLKKTLEGLETSKREREIRISELEKGLQSESKKRVSAEDKLKEITKKSSLADSLQTQLDDALSKLSTTQSTLDSASSILTDEIEGLKALLQISAELYGSFAAASVPKSNLENERLVRYELQSRLVKMERRLSDKDAQLQELVAYLRCKDEQQKLLQSSLVDAESEIAFLRDSLSLPDEQSSLVEAEAQALLLDNLTITVCSMGADLACTRTLEEYHRDWSWTLLDEYQSAGRCAASLEAALCTILERTAELDGQLQVAQVECNNAVKRAKEADVQVSSLQRENESIKERKEQQILDLATEKDTLAEESVEARRKLDDGRRRLERLETAVREKTAAEKALSDDIEGLTDALQDALRYEHAYKSLCQEVDALVSRNQLVEREAEHLSRFNAEILGHANPNQKIHYLDRIRRDLADAKQRLAVSTKQRETVLEDNDTLRNELHAYRSLSESQNRRGPTTRVHRVPLAMSSVNGSSPANSTGDGLPKVLEDQTLVISRNDRGPMTLDELMR